MTEPRDVAQEPESRRVDPTPDLTPAVTADGSAPDHEESPRDRLSAALRTPWSRGQAVAGVLLAVLGFAAVVQVRTVDEDQSFVGADQGDLIALINTLSLATDRAEDELAELRRTRDSLESDAQASRTALEVARRQADTLGILAGTLPAVGPGIRVTVQAPEGALGTDQLLNGLQELRNAGAEAVEINDAVRVVAQTGIVDDPGAGIVVDGQQLQPPYVLDVIGDPSTLATALSFEGGFTADVEEVGGSVTADELDSVEVATTRTVDEPEFAEPVEQE
jgi:uncharacterized protein YlxW (UPF0749 family)